MSDQRDDDYMRGYRAAFATMATRCAGELGGGDPTARLAFLEAERVRTVAALRRVCAEHGSNDWSDTLYLPDVVEKFLGRHLDADDAPEEASSREFSGEQIEAQRARLAAGSDDDVAEKQRYLLEREADILGLAAVMATATPGPAKLSSSERAPTPREVAYDLVPAVLTMLDATLAGIEEQQLSHGGCTRLPREMLDALGLHDGDLVWFLRSTPGGRWEAWTSAELDEELCMGQALGPEHIAARKAAVDALPHHVASRLTAGEARRLAAKGWTAGVVWYHDDRETRHEVDDSDLARLRGEAGDVKPPNAQLGALEEAGD